MKNRPRIIQKHLNRVPNLVDYDKAYRSFHWSDAAKFVNLFPDGTLNIAYNCIDRHVESGREDKTALVFEAADSTTERYTYGQLAIQTNKFAHVLHSLSVTKGDRVFIFLPPVPERYIAFLGTIKTGAIAGTMFAAFQEMALLDRLTDSEASVVVTNAELYPRIKRIQDALPHLKHIIVVERGGGVLPTADDVHAYSELMERAGDVFAAVPMQSSDPAYMLYTSGTTGKPKGIVHGHGDLAQIMTSTRYVLDLQEEDIYWCTADLGWVTGVVYGTFGVWGIGGTSVVYEGRFSPENWYGVLQKHQVTVWYSAPTAIRLLMGADVQPEAYELSSLRHLCSVGEPLNPEAIWWSLDHLGLPFHDTWWQTELGSICISNYPPLDIKPGSMGKPLPGVEAAIIDDEGNPVPIGTEGNLALASATVPALMKSIWRNKAKYESYFMDKWYISGDRARQDAQGYFWFIGRADDVINTAGERIGPFEVESALVSYPGVVEAGVIGKPDTVRGEIIKAFVVVKPEVVKDEAFKEALAAHVKAHLAGHAYPREIEFIEHLPKTRSGKIMRRVLKAQELGLPVGDTSTLENY